MTPPTARAQATADRNDAAEPERRRLAPNATAVVRGRSGEQRSLPLRMSPPGRLAA